MTADETRAQINAAVPPEYDLSFEWRELAVTEDHMALALVPVQWEQEDSRYEYEDDRLDFFTEYDNRRLAELTRIWSLLA